MGLQAGVHFMHGFRPITLDWVKCESVNTS
jgi:hypothetical protein